MKNKYKSKFTLQPLISRDRLNELGYLLCVAIQRLLLREREKFSKNSLDFIGQQSVTAPSTRKNGGENK